MQRRKRRGKHSPDRIKIFWRSTTKNLKNAPGYDNINEEQNLTTEEGGDETGTNTLVSLTRSKQGLLGEL